MHAYVSLSELCICTACVLGAHGGQKTVTGALELELHVAINGLVGAGSQIHVLCKSSLGSELLGHLFSAQDLLSSPSSADCDLMAYG